jgi:hypothetical protein
MKHLLACVLVLLGAIVLSPSASAWTIPPLIPPVYNPYAPCSNPPTAVPSTQTLLAGELSGSMYPTWTDCESNWSGCCSSSQTQRFTWNLTNDCAGGSYTLFCNTYTQLAGFSCYLADYYVLTYVGPGDVWTLQEEFPDDANIYGTTGCLTNYSLTFNQ